eukprot:GHVS01052267.1.p1 GENE.GHVS01052267.1~~GHVS01052267.1.p1  ORF type:complete len:201 (-),score=21.85 GHVS01052267.1:56-658(-)
MCVCTTTTHVCVCVCTTTHTHTSPSVCRYVHTGKYIARHGHMCAYYMLVRLLFDSLSGKRNTTIYTHRVAATWYVSFVLYHDDDDDDGTCVVRTHMHTVYSWCIHHAGYTSYIYIYITHVIPPPPTYFYRHTLLAQLYISLLTQHSTQHIYLYSHTQHDTQHISLSHVWHIPAFSGANNTNDDSTPLGHNWEKTRSKWGG